MFFFCSVNIYVNMNVCVLRITITFVLGSRIVVSRN